MDWILGTAQWGMDYGVTNRSGRLTDDTVHRVLEVARQNGIRYLDTAAGYGDAQSRIRRLCESENFQIVTKIDVGSERNLSDQIKRTKEELSVERLDCILIHNSDVLLEPTLRDSILSQLETLQNDSTIDNVGVSVYDVAQTRQITEVWKPDVIQLPLNIWNQDFLHTEELERLKLLGISLHARSLFLQGVLLSETLPRKLIHAQEQFDRWKVFLNDLNCTPLEACCSFAYDQDLIDAWVIGVESESQLSEILTAVPLQKEVSWTSQAANQQSVYDPRMW